MKNINNLKKLATLALLFSPTLTFAALGGLKSLLGDFKDILDLVWGLVITLCFIYFFWGVGQFILNAGDPKARQDGRQKIIWGVIALFVIMSIYGILNFIGTSLDLDGVSPGGVTCPPVCQ